MKLITIIFVSIFAAVMAAQHINNTAIIFALLMIGAFIVNVLFVRNHANASFNRLTAKLLEEHQFKASKTIQLNTFKEIHSSGKGITILIDKTKNKTCVATIETKQQKLDFCMLVNFTCTQNINVSGSKKILMLDENSSFLCIVDYSLTKPTSRFIPHTSIVSSEVYEGGVSITQSKRLNQLGGVIVGGILLGGAGAIIGGLSGKKKTSELTNDITLRLCINDISNPIIDLQFLNEETAKNGDIYKHYSEQARRWHTILSILIKRADSESQTSETQSSETPKSNFNGSLAEEIKKLSDLRENGAITDEEYASLKLKLISQS